MTMRILTDPSQYNRIRQETNDLLARILADEDIEIRRVAGVPTASWNVETNTLTLPIYKSEMPDDVEKMFIFHEVGHALFTPRGIEAFNAALDAVDPNNRSVARDYINVVEDARIERMMKTRYRGSRVTFAAGYAWAYSTNLFGIGKATITIDGWTLIDRINLHYKIGHIIKIPFTAEEFALARAVSETRTWDDVLRLSKAIYEFVRNQSKDQPKDQPKDQSEGQPDGNEDQSEGQPDGNEGQDEGQSKDQSEGQPKDQDEDQDEDQSKDQPKGQDEGGTGDGDAMAPATGGTEDALPTPDAPPISRTAAHANSRLLDAVDTTPVDHRYIDLPEPNENFVCPMGNVLAMMRHYADQKMAYSTPCMGEIANGLYEWWLSANKSAVQTLAIEFDRRKAADEQRRTQTADTGIIDPARIVNYKVSDDIFLRNEIVATGKNHGIIMLVDMSGSMAPTFHATMQQVLLLAHFCRRVRLPFRILGFTDRSPMNLESGFRKTPDWESIPTWLTTLLESGMTQQDFAMASGILLLGSYAAGSCGRTKTTTSTRKFLESKVGAAFVDSFSYPPFLRLGGTPTVEAMAGLLTVAAQFKAQHRVQVLNTIVLTDGEPTGGLSCYLATPEGKENPTTRTITYIRDPFTKRTIESGVGSLRFASWITDIYRKRIGGKVIAFHLTRTKTADGDAALTVSYHPQVGYSDPNRRKVAPMSSVITPELAANGWVQHTGGRGYDEYIYIQADTSTTNSVEETDLDRMGKTKFLAAVRRELSSNRANRPLLLRIADLISK